MVSLNHGSAIEFMPEYSSLSESEEESFDEISRFDSEYQSDLLTYMKSFLWEYEWISRRNALDLSVGSTSEHEFGINNRIKLEKGLTEALDFHWTFVDDRSRDREILHPIIELVYWPHDRVGVSLYGEPGFHKRTNDLGMAFLWTISPTHQIRFFHTFVDVTRPQRNDRNDTFVSPHLPYSRGMVGRLWSPVGSGRSEFVQYSFRDESETHWIFPDGGYEYRYRKRLASIILRQNYFVDSFYLNAAVQFDQKLESKSATGAPSVIAEEISVETERALFLCEGEWSEFLKHNWTLFSGVEWVSRNWMTLKGSAHQRDFLPYIWLSLPAWRRGADEDRWRVGLQGVWHRAHGSSEIKSNLDLDGRLEQRLNLSYDFSFSSDPSGSELRVLLTADLDRAFSDFQGVFEGGSAQFRTAW